MNKFLLTGQLGDLRVGMDISEAVSILGEPEGSGKGLRGWRIESYAGGCLQVCHTKGVIGLIGIYFRPEKRGSPLLPPATKCEVPFSGQTTPEEFKAYLDANSIPWEMDLRLRDATSLNVGGIVFASFEDDHLHSLLVSAE